MLRLTSILLAVLASLVPASAASARSRDPLRGARLQSATGTLTITETRCPQGSSACGKATLDEKFDAAGSRTNARKGLPGFLASARISGQGTGQCYAESPPTAITGPDGSLQFIGSAARLVPGKFDSTRIAGSRVRRGARIAWLEPLAPGIGCDYFGEPDTTLALPAAKAGALVSPRISTQTLKRPRFSVTIAGSQEWNEPQSDGSQVNGRASWHLKLKYAR